MPEQLININKHMQLKFAFKGVLLEQRKKSVGLIILREKESNEKEIHDISEFLIDTYRNSSFGTIRKKGYHLVSFLNYLIHEEKIFSLADLNLESGAHFLEYLGNEKSVSEETVKSAEKVLIDLYRFLDTNGCLPNVDISVFDEKGFFGKNPFNILYPSRKTKDIPHNIPSKYIPTILKIAEKIAAPIAFGIFLQIQGGLRNSEVVSLRLGDIQIVGIGGRFGFEVKLKKGSIVRSDTRYYISTVKKERKQVVYSIDPWAVDNIGMRLFNRQTKEFIASDGSYALFSNPVEGKHKGKAMTKKNYARYFNKVRDVFCRQLMKSDYPEEIALGERLARLEWSTHICRGIFTNTRAAMVDNAAQLQHDRGDDSPLSAQVYFEKQKIQENQKSILSGQTEYLKRLSGKAEIKSIDDKTQLGFVPMVNIRGRMQLPPRKEEHDFDAGDPYLYFKELKDRDKN
ncbi:hypothetical protein MO973_24625 [Paenibacillus sp. TRM 82003]|nr:hypothetical protein [Paenibacillus sp. TRM 82003]MCI3923417.1 hypothetical protein [Paenibacillus sp. TRM 82003]